MDIAAAIDAHVHMIIDVLDRIIEKSAKTIFEANSNQKKEIESELTDLRVEKAGGLVFKADGGPKIVVTFAGAKSE